MVNNKFTRKSNTTRLNALCERTNYHEKQSEIIKAALVSKTKSARITFDSDSSSDQDQKNVSLFTRSVSQSSSDSSSDEDFFSRQSAPKSLDSRFNLDEQFSETPSKEQNINGEVSHTLSLLADITGDTVIYSNEQKDNKFSDPSQKRYDPTSLPKGSEDLVKTTETPLKKRKIDTSLENSSRFMTVEGNLTSAFGAKKVATKSSGFSFDFSAKNDSTQDNSENKSKSRFGGQFDSDNDDMSISDSSSTDENSESSETSSNTKKTKDLPKHRLELNLPTADKDTMEIEIIDGIPYPKAPDWPLTCSQPESRFESRQEKKIHLFSLLKKRMNNYKKSQT